MLEVLFISLSHLIYEYILDESDISDIFNHSSNIRFVQSWLRSFVHSLCIGVDCSYSLHMIFTHHAIIIYTYESYISFRSRLSLRYELYIRVPLQGWFDMQPRQWNVPQRLRWWGAGIPPWLPRNVGWLWLSNWYFNCNPVLFLFAQLGILLNRP